MTRFALLAALLSAATSACLVAPHGHSNEFEVRISPAFSPEEQGKILDQMVEWQAHIPELRLHLSIGQPCGDGEENCISFETTTPEDLKAKGGEQCLGYTLRNSRIERSRIKLSSARCPTNSYCFGNSALHEFGHALGLDHPEDHAKGEAMSAAFSAWKPLVITCQDLRQYYGQRGVKYECPIMGVAE